MAETGEKISKNNVMNNTGEKTTAAGGSHLNWFVRGLRDGIPICMGYFAVSFALGITARGIGMTAFQAGLMSFGMVASAGEFAAIVLIQSAAGIIEMITTCIVVNLDPFYSYGMTVVSVAGWTSGTVLGVLMGNIMPAWAVSALSVSLYGMFLAIIIPPARKDRFIAGLVLVSMTASGLFSLLPVLRDISGGFKVIILTLLIAGAAAFIHPIDTQNGDAADDSVSSDMKNDTVNNIAK